MAVVAKSGEVRDSVGRSSQQNMLVDIHLVVYTVLIPQGRGDTSGNTCLSTGNKETIPLKSTEKGTN